MTKSFKKVLLEDIINHINVMQINFRVITKMINLNIVIEG